MNALDSYKTLYTNNPAPLLDLKEVVNQVQTYSKIFRLITTISDKKKFITQLKPDLEHLPAVGFTVDYGSGSNNLINTSMGQNISLVLCCTVVMSVAGDLSGSKSHYDFISHGLTDLMHCIYNWQPDVIGGRYTNSFQFDSFDRIENLCNNVYEVYCVYFSIPCQIDYLDGFIPQANNLDQISISAKVQKLQEINTQFNVQIQSQTTS